MSRRRRRRRRRSASGPAPPTSGRTEEEETTPRAFPQANARRKARPQDAQFQSQYQSMLDIAHFTDRGVDGTTRTLPAGAEDNDDKGRFSQVKVRRPARRSPREDSPRPSCKAASGDCGEVPPPTKRSGSKRYSPTGAPRVGYKLRARP